MADTVLTFEVENGGRDVDPGDLPRFEYVRSAQARRLHPLVLWMAVAAAVLLLLFVALMVVRIVVT